MKKLVIGDVTTLTDSNRIYGHFAKVAKQYKEILDSEYEVIIAGGKTYYEYFKKEEILELPYFIKLEDNYGGTKGKLRRKIKEFINARKILRNKSNIVIFQCLNETAIYLALLFGSKSNVYMIQYQNGLNSKIKRILFEIVKNRIKGLIVSSKVVGEYYGINYCVVPDYFPKKENNINKSNILYDAVLLGTISDWKNYEDVISSFSNTKFKILIAGKFNDEKYYNKLINLASNNIIIINKYLSEDEYKSYIEQSRYVLLPYRKEYENKSSGVLLDALYKCKPVITPRLNSFKIVEDFKMGLSYNESICEVIEILQDNEVYINLMLNIDKYIIKMYEKRNKLISFINEKEDR